MPTLAEACALILDNSDAWGVSLSPGLSEAGAMMAKVRFEQSLGVSFATDYERFLSFSNGMQSERGVLSDAASVHGWGVEHLREKGSLEQLRLGAGENGDLYVFHLASREYRVTSSGGDRVYASFEHLADLLLYIADPSVALGASVKR